MKRHLKRYIVDQSAEPVQPVAERGLDLIHNPILNKGSGFSEKERDELGLRGLVPPRVMSLENQVKRVRENYNRKTTDLEKYIFMESLHARNETLYYRFLLENLEEITPIIYTPVVGTACQQFGHIFRFARGMYFSTSERGQFRKIMNHWPEDEIDIIVVTDGSRILGLGDLGASGMGISIGKLALYVACAGIYLHKTLPVVLDVGTNNEDLISDPLYLGETHKRLSGDEYYDMVDEFVTAARDRWPLALIQWEDFTNDHAFPLLEKYRDKVLCFNDDIQGTGSVALAGILGSLRITGGKLSEQRIVFLGAGSAGIGIADMIVAGMVEEGLLVEEARRRFWFIDSRGLVTTTRGDKLADHKIPYARDDEFIPALLEVVEKVKPTILMGLSSQPGSFTKEVIQEMNKHVDRPVVFALSNPTSKSECTAEQAYAWTDGAVVFAGGSPFDPVEYNGKTYVPGQGNNMYIFPGVGLGATVCGAKKITDSMFFVAAKTLASMVPDDFLTRSTVYPSLKNIREISANIAVAVCEVAYDEGIARIERPDNLLEYVKSKMFQPVYVPYEAV